MVFSSVNVLKCFMHQKKSVATFFCKKNLFQLHCNCVPWESAMSVGDASAMSVASVASTRVYDSDGFPLLESTGDIPMAQA